MFFADILLLFVDAGDDQVWCKEGLELSCKALGQHVNFAKSLIYFSHNVLDQDAQRMSQNMGIPKMTELRRYFGHQIVHKGNNHELHAHLLQKLKDRLEGWKANCISRAGQITLSPICDEQHSHFLYATRETANKFAQRDG